ncbi:hypothetical protein [Streptomyces sp. 351MFTsu5.1]|uniref:hypothetical protein n=1 Tax=Streptomyces sp. 351MFTsu5.1 TaxID=1172180 RepID=UPI000362132F|nr:hypothetical protein [Streptomyces sp. 351MFTsu5.1]
MSAVGGEFRELFGGGGVAPGGETAQLVEVVELRGELDEFGGGIGVPRLGAFPQGGQVGFSVDAVTEAPTP